MGSFFAARKSGVVVEEFGFGLPPAAKTVFKQGGTNFTLNWIPFGGFVRLKGENAIDRKEHTAPGSFGAASIPARITILCAGVFMNFILALIILVFGFSLGRWIPTYTTLEEMEAASERGVIHLDLAVRIDEVISGGGAAQVGVPEKSLITAINGEVVKFPSDISEMQDGKATVEYTILSGEEFAEEQTFTVPLEDGKAGVVLIAFPRELSSENRPLHTATYLALRESWVMMVQTVAGIGQLFVSLAQTGSVPEGITGIVGIAQLTHASVQEGVMTYLRLVALLSLSLAVLNILPFPALDGGRLIFVLAEGATRRPVNRKVELVANGIGFVFLILLILLITYHDIVRLF